MLYPRYNRRMRQVVAGMLEREGKILVGQRQPGQSHALEWEFPGGKVEPGETPNRRWRGSWKKSWASATPAAAKSCATITRIRTSRLSR